MITSSMNLTEIQQPMIHNVMIGFSTSLLQNVKVLYYNTLKKGWWSRYPSPRSYVIRTELCTAAQCQWRTTSSRWCYCNGTPKRQIYIFYASSRPVWGAWLSVTAVLRGQVVDYSSHHTIYTGWTATKWTEGGEVRMMFGETEKGGR